MFVVLQLKGWFSLFICTGNKTHTKKDVLKDSKIIGLCKNNNKSAHKDILPKRDKSTEIKLHTTFAKSKCHCADATNNEIMINV